MSLKIGANRSATTDARRRLLLICAGAATLLALTAIAYLPSLKGGYIWDDDYYVTANPLLSARDGLWKIWFSPLSAPSQYFPLVYTTFRLEYSLWHFNALGYKLVNLALHVGNALLVWRILQKLRLRGAWLAACIFALHPVQVESVAWITERKNVLSTLFYLLSVLAWVGYVDKRDEPVRRYIICFVLFALALFAKTTACTLPAAMVLILWMRGERLNFRWIKLIAPFVAWGLAMGAVTVIVEHVKQGTRGPEFSMPMIDRLLVASRALWFYLAKLLWPVNLMFSYPKWNIDARNPMQYLWVAATVGAAVLVWRYRNRSRPIVAGLTFFAAALFPMLGFFSLFTFLYTYVADHYAYLAMVGPVAIVSAILFRKWKPPAVKLAARYALAPALLAILFVLTWNQSHVYASAARIWTDVLDKNPGSWMAHNNLAAILIDRHDYGGAREHLRQALSLRPRHAEAMLNMGRVDEEQGQLESAIDWYQKAAQIRPDYDASYYNLGRALAKKGDLAGATAAYDKTLEINPQHTWARTNLGVILFDQGRYDDAIAQYRIVLEQDPGSISARTNLGKVFLQQKRIPEAITQWNIVMQEDTTNANVPYALGILYGQMGRLDDAIHALQIAIQRNPNFTDAKQYLELAQSQKRAGQSAGATTSTSNP